CPLARATIRGVAWCTAWAPGGRPPWMLIAGWAGAADRSSGRLGLEARGDNEARDHVVASDGADELDELVGRQNGLDSLHRGRLDLDVARHLVGESERGQLRLVEVLAVLERSGGILEGGELLLGAARLEELTLVLEPFVLGVVEHADGHDRDLAELAGQAELLADGPEHGVPGLSERRAVQEHPIEVEQLAAGSAGTDRGHDVGWPGGIAVGAVRDSGPGHVGGLRGGRRGGRNRGCEKYRDDGRAHRFHQESPSH